METSFIKKIVSITEFENVCRDLNLLFEEDNKNYGHSCGLIHDVELITKCFSNESLLMWNMHIWAHFNGKTWDGIFAGFIRKSEKFNKKMMDEYLWLSKNSNSGLSLYKTALEFAKKNNCEYVSLNVVENHPKSDLLKKLYKKIGFEKDYECYIKKI